MPSIQLADVAGPGLFLALGIGLIAAGLIFLFVIFLESLILWLLKWGSFWRSLLDALLVNIVSSLFGFLVIGLLQRWLFLGTLFAGLLSILIEGGVLALLRRHPARKTWQAAAAINTASYGLLLLVILALMLLGRA